MGKRGNAWFVNQTQVTAETATTTSSTAYTLLISQGAKASDGSSQWGTTHAWVDGASAKALTPVSTVGTLNGSKELDFMKDNAWKSATADAVDIVKGGNYANTFQAAAETDYIKETFEIKAIQDCQLILDSDTVIKGASGELDRVLRLALVIDDGTA